MPLQIIIGRFIDLSIQKYIALFFLLMAPAFALRADSGEDGPLLYLGGHFYGGRIEIHSSRIEYFGGVSPVGGGLDLSWKFVSEQAYSLCQCYPSLGASLTYWDFGHHSLGNALSGMFYVEPVLFSPFDTDISLRAGLGMSYMDHPYDAETNPLNITYSTHFAFPLMVGVSFSHSLGDKWNVRLSGEFQHISNGGTHQPNLGINYLTAGLGIQRKLTRRKLPDPPAPSPFDPAEGLRRVEWSLISGLKEPEGEESQDGVFSFSGEYLHQFGRINAWSAGFMVENDNSREGSSQIDHSRMSVMGGHAFLLGRFTFAQKAGLYLWSGHPTKAPWFQYYTLDFSVSQRLGIGVGLKAHGKVAEFLGVRLLLR